MNVTGWSFLTWRSLPPVMSLLPWLLCVWCMIVTLLGMSRNPHILLRVEFKTKFGIQTWTTPNDRMSPFLNCSLISWDICSTLKAYLKKIKSELESSLGMPPSSEMLHHLFSSIGLSLLSSHRVNDGTDLTTSLWFCKSALCHFMWQLTNVLCVSAFYYKGHLF